MGERGKRSQVSSEGEVDLKCFKVFLFVPPPIGCPASPFIVQGEAGLT
jgi:hypothetical protein